MGMVDVRQRDINGFLLPTDRFVSNPTYETQTCLDLAIPIFSPSQVNVSIQIGQGCFGKVFKGKRFQYYLYNLFIISKFYR